MKASRTTPTLQCLLVTFRKLHSLLSYKKHCKKSSIDWPGVDVLLPNYVVQKFVWLHYETFL